MVTINIYCCGCREKVDALLIDGSEAYPKRTDLHDLPFWKCDKCKTLLDAIIKQKTELAR